MARTATPDARMLIDTAPAARAGVDRRPTVRGKFLFVGDRKLYLRGVSYGPFRPNGREGEYGTPDLVSRDFALMAANGVNAIRTYTVPPRWLLDAARRFGLWVLVGLPWEQHTAFLDDRVRRRSIERRVRAGARACAGHPAVLGFAVGNEIPGGMVRWYGYRRVERFLHRLTRAVKSEDAGALVTYVSYPTTEYLQLPFIDIVCFNVYLEAQPRLASYLARLQNLADDRPLVMGEIGLDSRRNGLAAQASTLDWQVRTAFAAGCAGSFVFAWTDEWHRGGFEIEDWDFGLTDRRRRPKPALHAVASAFREAPFPDRLAWPRISVIVCTHNGSRTIRECCEGLRKLDYPSFEVIVVNDGSTDTTAAIIAEYGYKTIKSDRRGLSAARNAGLEVASGEIVAYTDDDAYPDPHWLTYLAATFISTDRVAVGGPNLAPPGDGPLAECVANAPGRPTHVLLSDDEAEHIPGCNMAFRRAALAAVGGFDPAFRIAGDDVDVCWRLQQAGGSLGFSPAAVVWHHHRDSIAAYWRQQLNYGKAEGMLERKWPEKYNALGHPCWQGRLYGNGRRPAGSLGRRRIRHGVWGTGLFQSIYDSAPGGLLSLPLVPDWYFGILGLALLSLLGLAWEPARLALPLLLGSLAVLIGLAALGCSRARFREETVRAAGPLRLHAVTALLHFLQPLARSSGRIASGLTPWRRRFTAIRVLPWPRTTALWSECGRTPERWLEAVEAHVGRRGGGSVRGGPFDRWDLEIRGGLLGSARTRAVSEEHGSGRQLVRFRVWPRLPVAGLVSAGVLGILAGVAALDQAWPVALVVGALALLIGARIFGDCAAAMTACDEALERLRAEEG